MKHVNRVTQFVTQNLRRLMLAVSATLAVLSSPCQAKDLVIALDVSASNPLMADPVFQKRAAQYVGSAVADLKSGDRVVIKLLGSLNTMSNLGDQVVTIKRHNAGKVAGQVAGYLLALNKNTAAQGSTNILAWLGRNPMDCGDGSRLLMVTDAIEASEYVDGNALLAGKQSLPEPGEFVALAGCQVTFYGVGIGRLDQEMNRLRAQWQAYFDKAGAQFEAVVL